MASLRNVLIERLAFPVVQLGLQNGFYSRYRELQESQWLTQGELETIQLERLIPLLGHASQQVSLYRELFRARGLSIEDFRSIDDLQRLPVLTKDDFREGFPERCTADDVERDRWIPNSTSGSTGTPFAFFMDRNLTGAKLANYFRNYRWAGIRPGDRILKLWGTHDADWKEALFIRHVLRREEFSAFDIDRRGDELLELIRTHRPRAMEAYTSAAVKLAYLLRERGVDDISFDMVVTSSEPLYSHQRELIAEVFQADVFDRYGSREFGIVAFDCEHHAGLHVNSETNIVEVVDEVGQRLPPGQEGRLAITSLTNYVMPLIRYEIGDVGAYSRENCPCGRGLPLLEGITGRVTDFLELPSGRRLPFMFFNHFFEGYGPFLRQFQVVYHPGERLTVRLIPTSEFASEHRKRIVRGLEREIDGEIPINTEMVDRIPLTKSGKVRPVVVEDPID